MSLSLVKLSDNGFHCFILGFLIFFALGWYQMSVFMLQPAETRKLHPAVFNPSSCPASLRVSWCQPSPSA